MIRVSFELTGYIFRRRGQQEEGERNLERSVQLDPRNPFALQQLAISYQFLRRYPEMAAVTRGVSSTREQQVSDNFGHRNWVNLRENSKTPILPVRV